MLDEIMRHLRNYFATSKSQGGKFEITDGTLSPSFVSEGQYFLIEGSTFNDGVHKAPATDLTNETFEGYITLLAPPKAFLSLAAEIEDYEANNTVSPYTSESFGGYSYTRATNSSGNAAGWQDIFKTKLDAWRKI